MSESIPFWEKMDQSINKKKCMIRGILIDFFKKYSGTSKKLSVIRQQQWLSPARIEALQQKRLSRLLLYSYKHVPYYRDVFDKAEVIDKKGRVILEHFKNIPFLDKGTIRNNFNALQSDQIKKRKWRYKNTGGSTGEPCRVIQDLERAEWVDAVKSLRNDWVKFKPGYPKATFVGIVNFPIQRKEALVYNMNRWIANSIYFNAFDLSSARMNGYARKINRFRPVLIKGYSNSLYQFSCFIKKENILIHSPRSIICSAGTLTGTMRRIIEEAFQTKIFNSYGSREIQAMAFECPSHVGLHVISPLIHFEILRKDGSKAMPGEIGEVILTPFFNYAMPLIRYRIGDMASWSKKTCKCGRSWPLIENIVGRTLECFITADSGIISPEFFMRIFRSCDDWISKYQIIQDDINKITVLIVTPDKCINPYEKYKEKIEHSSRKIRAEISRECKVNFRFVSDIAGTQSGKYLTTICKISPFGCEETK